MLNSRVISFLGGMVIAGSCHGFGVGWSDVFPPLSPEDVEALGAAAEIVDKGRGDGADGTVSWENDRTGTHGTVQGLKSFQRDGRHCRNYRLFIKVRGFEPYHAEPIMCKADDGKWKFATRNR